MFISVSNAIAAFAEDWIIDWMTECLPHKKFKKPDAEHALFCLWQVAKIACAHFIVYFKMFY